MEQLLQAMPDSERERILHEKLPARRREKVIAYQLLWDCLRQEQADAPAPILHYSPLGQPFLVNYPDIHISISHCKTAVAVALDSQPIGVDVEHIRPYNAALMQRSFSIEEQQEIATSPDPDSTFTRLWTRKEAYLKRLGTGITGMDNLQQVPPPGSNIETQPLPDGLGWVSVCVSK